jgi:hypothetical protein
VFAGFTYTFRISPDRTETLKTKCNARIPSSRAAAVPHGSDASSSTYFSVIALEGYNRLQFSHCKLHMLEHASEADTAVQSFEFFEALG